MAIMKAHTGAEKKRQYASVSPATRPMPAAILNTVSLLHLSVSSPAGTAATSCAQTHTTVRMVLPGVEGPDHCPTPLHICCLDRGCPVIQKGVWQ